MEDCHHGVLIYLDVTNVDDTSRLDGLLGAVVYFEEHSLLTN